MAGSLTLAFPRVSVLALGSLDEFEKPRARPALFSCHLRASQSQGRRRKRKIESQRETEREWERAPSNRAKGLTDHLVLNFPDAFVDKMEEIILISTLVSISWRKSHVRRQALASGIELITRDTGAYRADFCQ